MYLTQLISKQQTSIESSLIINLEMLNELELAMKLCETDGQSMPRCFVKKNRHSLIKYVPEHFSPAARSVYHVYICPFHRLPHQPLVAS